MRNLLPSSFSSLFFFSIFFSFFCSKKKVKTVEGQKKQKNEMKFAIHMQSLHGLVQNTPESRDDKVLFTAMLLPRRQRFIARYRGFFQPPGTNFVQREEYSTLFSLLLSLSIYLFFLSLYFLCILIIHNIYLYFVKRTLLRFDICKIHQTCPLFVSFSQPCACENRVYGHWATCGYTRVLSSGIIYT